MHITNIQKKKLPTKKIPDGTRNRLQRYRQLFRPERQITSASLHLRINTDIYLKCTPRSASKGSPFSDGDTDAAHCILQKDNTKNTFPKSN